MTSKLYKCLLDVQVVYMYIYKQCKCLHYHRTCMYVSTETIYGESGSYSTASFHFHTDNRSAHISAWPAKYFLSFLERSSFPITFPSIHSQKQTLSKKILTILHTMGRGDSQVAWTHFWHFEKTQSQNLIKNICVISKTHCKNTS